MSKNIAATSRTGRRTQVVAAIAVAVAVLAASCTSAAKPAPRPSSDGSAASAAPTVTPNPAHLATLTGVLQKINTGYSDYGNMSPGAEDIVDYDIGGLWMRGIDGTGTTIALVEGWNDPDIGTEITKLDQTYGLPAPDIRTIYPTGSGRLPAQCPAGMVALGDYGSCGAWAGELDLDVESAHLIAPYAKILLVVAPPDSETTDDAASQVAPPEMMEAVEYVASHHLADVISISDGTGESTYSHGKPEITAQDAGELTAAAEGVPVVVGTGDCGAVQNLAVASSQCGDTSTAPDTAVWDDSPWITAVGGSVPSLSQTGERTGPDTVWHQGRAAEGAGSSSVYARPAYQNGVVTGPMRAVPDITMDAQSGTSEATPLFGGVLDLAAQLNGGPTGPVNNALYQVLGPHGAQDGITDIVTGSNAVPAAPGFSAGPGFDAATGWGTVDAAVFVPALAAAVRAQQGPNTPAKQAAAALARLEAAAHLSTTDPASGRSAQLTADGFLPGHPVVLAVDGKKISTLTADSTGAVAYTLAPDALKLAAGKHVLTLQSMLLTEHADFRTR